MEVMRIYIILTVIKIQECNYHNLMKIQGKQVSHSFTSLTIEQKHVSDKKVK